MEADKIAKIGMYALIAYGVYEVGTMFGIFKSKEETANEAAAAAAAASSTVEQPNDPFVAFNPNYAGVLVATYNKKFKPKVFNATYNMYGITQQGYKDLADRVYNAQGTFNDDEDTLYDIFRSLQTQWQLSVLSNVFHAFHQKDMLMYLKSFLNATELNDLLTMVKNYPQYRKA